MQLPEMNTVGTTNHVLLRASRQDHKDVVAGSNSAFYKDSGLPANSAGVFAEIDPLQLNARNKMFFLTVAFRLSYNYRIIKGSLIFSVPTLLSVDDWAELVTG